MHRWIEYTFQFSPRRMTLILALLQASVSSMSLAIAAPTSIPDIKNAYEIGFSQRAHDIISLIRTAPDIDSNKFRPFNRLVTAAATKCTDSSVGEFVSRFAKIPAGQNPQEPVDFFGMPAVIRILYQFADCVTPAQKDQLLEDLTSRPQRLFSHGTINHAILRASSWYLLAQYFPTAKWIDWDGKFYTSPQLMGALRKLMLQRTAGFFRQGHGEWLSPTYAMLDFFPLLNIYDFASDSELKVNASNEATLELSVLKASSFHGVIVPPLSRRNFEQHNGSSLIKNYVPSVSQQLLKLYFGEPEFFSDYEFVSGREPSYIAIPLLSSWRLNPSAMNALLTKDGYDISIVTPHFSVWGAKAYPTIFGSAYISTEYAIASGNLVFSPAEFFEDFETFSVKLRFNSDLNTVECYHPFFQSNAGYLNWGSDRWSPFLQTHRFSKNEIVLIANIPKKDPWPADANDVHFKRRDAHSGQLIDSVYCRIPKSFEDIDVSEKGLFTRAGHAATSLIALGGSIEEVEESLFFRVFKFKGPRVAIYSRTEEISGAQDFSNFKSRALLLAPSYSQEDSSVQIRIGDKLTETVKFRISAVRPNEYDARPVVSGVDMTSIQDWPIESSLLTLKQGVLAIGEVHIHTGDKP